MSNPNVTTQIVLAAMMDESVLSSKCWSNVLLERHAMMLGVPNLQHDD